MIKVSFLTSINISWVCLESIYQRCIESDLISVNVCFYGNYQATPYLSESFDKMKRLLEDSNIPYNSSFGLLTESDYVFISNASPPLLPEGVHALRAKIIYVPYAISISNAAYSMQLQYNELIHQMAWRIFTLNDFYKGMYQKHNKYKGRNVVALGYSKFDQFLRNEKNKLSRADQKVVLWNIHYNQSNQSGVFTTWGAMGRKLLNNFSKMRDVTFIIRPHPFLFSHLQGTGDVEFIHSMVSKHDHLILDESDDYIQAFEASDAMITDASSLIVEYIPMLKPMCFTTSHGVRYLNDFAKLIVEECAVVADTSSRVDQFMQNLVNDEGLAHLTRAQADLCTGGVFGLLDGTVGEKIVDSVIQDYLSS